MSKLENYRFAILGRIIHGVHFVKELKRLGFSTPLVITSLDDEYLRDKRLLTKYGLWADFEELSKSNLCHLHKLETVNCEETIELLKKYNCNVGFSINCRDIIKTPIINYFNREIYNLHDSYLPNERGGALNTWRILNGINSVGNTIHYLQEGVDDGPIIVRREIEIDKGSPLPIDYLKAEVGNCEMLLTQVLDTIIEKGELPKIAQNNDESLYFPRQFTELNGLVNWDWEIEDIEKFVRAYSEPYPGSFSYYRKKKVNILDVEIDKTISERFHPHCNGRVVTCMNSGDVRVIAGKRALIIKKISVDGEVKRPSEILSTRFLFKSDPQKLHQAKGLLPTTKMMAQAEL